MGNVKCFMIEQTNQVRRYLRRFTYSSKKPCGTSSHEGGKVFLDTIEFPVNTHMKIEHCDDTLIRKHDKWPKKCEKCDYIFLDEDEWQIFPERIFRDPNTGNLHELCDVPAGAMWDARWWMDPDKNLKYEDGWVGPDGLSLYVMLPNRCEWFIDGMANNSKDKHGWIRTGVPPMITANPSILAADYHGWLRNGELVSC